MAKNFQYKSYYAYIIFAVFTFIFFQSQILGESWFWEDFLEAVYPIQTFAARESGNFSVPFWNPFSFNGMPFYADIQVGFFYIPNRLMNLFIRDNGTLPVYVLELLVIFHFLLAQISMFHLAKRFKLSFWASVLTAVIYSFSMLMVCHTIHPMIIYHFAWFPLVFSTFILALDKTSLKYAFLTPLLLGHMMLSGHPQSTLYIVFFLGVYFIWNTISRYRNNELGESSLLKVVLVAIISFTLSAGIFSVQLLPSNELAKLSQRSEISLEKAAEGSIDLKHMSSFLFPEIFGKVTGSKNQQTTYYLQMKTAEGTGGSHFYWETAFYFSIIGVLFGLIGMLLGYKQSQYLFLIVMAVFGFLFALGSNGPILPIFYELPLFGTFRHPVRIMIFTILGFALLSGFALDKLQKLKKLDIKVIIAVVAILLFGILGVSGLLFDLFDTPDQLLKLLSPSITRSFVLILISSGFIFGLVKMKSNKTIISVSVVLVCFVDLFISGSDFNKGDQNPEQVYSLDPSLISAFQAKPPNDIFRVNMRMYNPSYMALKRNQGLINQIMLVEGYNPLILQRPVPRYNSKDKIHKSLSVKYEIGVKDGRAQFFERFDRNPWVWTSRTYEVVNENDTENYLSSFEGDLKEFTILEEEPKINITLDSTASDKVNLLEYENDKMIISANVRSNCLLVLSEIFYPAWNAYVNGEHVDILRANHALRAIPLSMGDNKVEIVYESNAFLTGMWISIISLLIILIGFLVVKK